MRAADRRIRRGRSFAAIAAGETASAGGTVSGGTSSTGNTAWKQAYLDVLNAPAQWFDNSNFTEREVTGCLLYIDSDTVPELYLTAPMSTYALLTYHSGRINQLGEVDPSLHTDGLSSYIPYSGQFLWIERGYYGNALTTLYNMSGSGFRDVKSGRYEIDWYSNTSAYCEWEWGGESGYCEIYAGEPFYGAYHELIQRDYDLSRAVDMENNSSAGWMSYDELISYLSR